jgi:DNA-binding beta-propeller fold protein YncE
LSQGVSGSISGLEGSGLVLLNNGAGALQVPMATTSFSFSSVAESSGYNLSVAAQPVLPAQICTIANPAGIMGGDMPPPAVRCSKVAEVLFLAFPMSHSLEALSVDPITGALAPVPGSPVVMAPGATPTAMAVPAGGRFLYVLDAFNSQDPGSVAVFSIDSGSSAIAPLAGAAVPTGTRPRAISIDSAGRFAYVAAAEGIFVYSIDAVSGKLATVIGSPFASGVETGSFAIDPSGRFAYANSAQNTVWGFTLDSASGKPSPLPGSPYPAGPQPSAVAMDSNGRVLYWINTINLGSFGISAAAIQVDSGDLVPLAGSPYAFSLADLNGVGQPRAVSVDPGGREVWVWGWSAFLAFATDPSTGGLSPRDAGHPLVGLVAAGPSGRFLFSTKPCCVYGTGISVSRIDAASGQLTEVPGSPFGGVSSAAAAILVARVH